MKYFITGVTGSLGQTVTKKLLADGHEVVGFSRDEQKQRAMGWHTNLDLRLGDVRDLDSVLDHSRGCDQIIHCAALKCVDTLEKFPLEVIKTNVLGTQNVLKARRINRIQGMKLASTDKACYPVNAYGMSKALAERLTLNDGGSVCRYGNVLASRGSVIPMFVESLTQENKVYLTDGQMTRFFLRLETAADFVLGVEGPGLHIPPIKAARIKNVARSVARLLGCKNIDIEFIGVRPGEKIHECLRTQFEGDELHSNTPHIQMAETEIDELIAPVVDSLCKG